MKNTENMPALIDFFDWYQSQNDSFHHRPWLVLGKGPSFEKIKNVDLLKFNTFGLNHVVTETNLDISHIIDLDVVLHCENILPKNTRFLLMPWVPHTNGRPGKLSLAKLTRKIPVLGLLASEGRLLWYNKVGSRAKVEPHGSSPPVRVVSFSAEAPYALLGIAGAHTIRSIGIDGGNSYANHFSGLKTLLTNGWQSFDRQFQEIARSIMLYNIDASPLNTESPIRVYVATMEEQMISVKVLEYSIRKHASMTAEVIPMHKSHIEIPQPKSPSNWPRTPFSFQRFIIPKMAGYKGRAIYLDSDMQVFADIRELWEYDMADNDLLSVKSDSKDNRRPQYSVMLLNCNKLKWDISEIVASLDTGKLTYKKLMYKMDVASKQEALIPAAWNSLEKYVNDKTKLVHYTDMNTQPWIYAKHPFGHIWVRDLLEAIDNGFINHQLILDHVKKGWVRPSLAYQIKNKIEDAFLLPQEILDLDTNYSPPYHKLHNQNVSLWRNSGYYLKAKLRHILYGSSFKRIRSFVFGVIRYVRYRLRS